MGGGSSISTTSVRDRLPPRPKHIPSPEPSDSPVGGGGAGGGDIGGGAGGSEGGGAPDPCQIDSFETTLSNPAPLAIVKTQKNQRLLVDARYGNVCVVNLLGEECGVILAKSAQLLKCLQQGRRFVAVVKEVSIGQLRVEVRNA